MEDDEHSSYDGTEQTPQPKSYRPPPMHPGHATRRVARESLSSSALPSHRSLFSFSLGRSMIGSSAASSVQQEDTLPSMSVEPPSPMSRPSASLLGEEFSWSNTGSRFAASSSSASPSRTKPPPMSEVRVDTENEHANHARPAADDTFFECYYDDDVDDGKEEAQDRSLLQRTRRSLRMTPTLQNKLSPLLVGSTNTGDSASVASSFFNAADEIRNESLVSNGPSPLEVSRVHESALQALMRLKEELVKCNDRNKALWKEKEMWKQHQTQWDGEVQQLRASLKQMESSKANLERQVTNLQQERDNWTQERTEWDAKWRSATRERKESMHRKVAGENRQRELKHTLDRTQKELEEVTERETKLAHDYSIVNREKAELQQQNATLEKQLKTLQEEAHGKDKKVERLQIELGETKAELATMTQRLSQAKKEHEQECVEYEKQIEKWKQQYKQVCERHKAEMETVHSAAAAAAKPSPGRAMATTPVLRNGAAAGVRFQEDTSPLESSVADRLARMKDSAERAHLIKAHKRDLVRLKLEYEEKMQKLMNTHQDSLRKAQKEADAVLIARLEELKKSLNEEHEEQLQEVEERQREKFAEVRDEN